MHVLKIASRVYPSLWTSILSQGFVTRPKHGLRDCAEIFSTEPNLTTLDGLYASLSGLVLLTQHRQAVGTFRGRFLCHSYGPTH